MPEPRSGAILVTPPMHSKIDWFCWILFPLLFLSNATQAWYERPRVLPLADTLATSREGVPEIAPARGTRASDLSSRGYCVFLRSFGDKLLVFPEWDPNLFDEPPATVGPYPVSERLISFRSGGDGCPLDITVFEPVGLPEPKPALVWVLGSNVQPYFHQSLHETLASWGYVVIVPDTRPLTYVPDRYYHARNTANASFAIDKALRGRLGTRVDPDRIAAGGYSIGGTMASFLAAVDPRVKGQVFWAPTASPFWLGLQPEDLWPEILAPAYFLVGELDPIAPPDGFPSLLSAKMVKAWSEIDVISGGTHLYFMQPTGADSPQDPETDLTRFEQQGIAIEATRAWLDSLFGGGRL